MTTSAVIKPIHPANAFLARTELRFWDATDNTFKSWSGVAADLTFGFYRDADGTDGIAGLTGLAASEVGATGVYYHIVSAASTAALSPSLLNATIYLILEGGPSNEVKVATPLRVTEPRYAQ